MIVELDPVDYLCVSDEEAGIRIKKAINKAPKVNDKLRILAIEVLDYLNLKANKKFQPSDTNLSFIQARLREQKRDVSVLKSVIDNRCDEWLQDTKMHKFLRPATIFNCTRFAQYLGETKRRGVEDIINNFLYGDEEESSEGETLEGDYESRG